MKKVALIIDSWYPFVGGGQINCYEISKRISKHNYQIDILIPRFKSGFVKNEGNLKIVPVGISIESLTTVNRAIFCVFAFIWVLRHNYDLVHAHAFLPGLVARFSMLFCGIPAILTIHGFSFETNVQNWFAKFVEKLILVGTRYTCQLTVSRDFLGVDNVNKNVVFVPNAPAISKPFKKRQKTIELLTIARLHKQKNLVAYMQALRILKNSKPNFKAAIVGSGPMEKKLLECRERYSLGKNVSFVKTSDRKKISRLYRQSKLFVLPSVYEGQSLSILDAMASSTPVLVTSVGDNPFLIKNNRNGFLIDYPFEPEELSDSILLIFNNRNLDKIATNGYNLVKKLYSWEYSASKTLEVYEKSTSKKSFN